MASDSPMATCLRSLPLPLCTLPPLIHTSWRPELSQTRPAGLTGLIKSPSFAVWSSSDKCISSLVPFEGRVVCEAWRWLGTPGVCARTSNAGEGITTQWFDFLPLVHWDRKLRYRVNAKSTFFSPLQDSPFPASFPGLSWGNKMSGDAWGEWKGQFPSSPLRLWMWG